MGINHTVKKEREDLKIAGCWSHARHQYDEAVKALPKAKQKDKDSRAYLALTMIQTIYQEEKQLKSRPAEERRDCRQWSIRPMVETYFTWINKGKSPESAAEEQDLGRFPILHPPGKIPESIPR